MTEIIIYAGFLLCFIAGIFTGFEIEQGEHLKRRIKELKNND